MEKIIEQTIEIIDIILNIPHCDVQRIVSDYHTELFTISKLCEERKDIPEQLIYFIIKSLSNDPMNNEFTNKTQIILKNDVYFSDSNKANIHIEKARNYSCFLKYLFNFSDKYE